MREVRFFVPLENIKGNTVLIDGQEFKHLSKVLRLRVGDSVSIICNDSNIRQAKITKINKDNALAQIVSVLKKENTGADITVFLALIKQDPLSLAVQKCTELGVNKFVPFSSKFSVVVDKGQIKPRLERIVQSSCKQCGRLFGMQIDNTVSFDEMCDILKQFDSVIVAYEKDTTNAKSILSKLNKKEKIAIVIGGEGGFSAEEIKKLNAKNIKFVSLGKLILRAETATMALVSAIKYELGEFTNENINVNTGV